MAIYHLSFSICQLFRALLFVIAFVSANKSFGFGSGSDADFI